MRVLLGCLLLGFLLIARAEVSTLEINVNQKKVALPYWAPDMKSKGGVVILFGDPPVYGIQFGKSLAEQLAKRGWSAVVVTADSGTGKDSWIDQVPEALAALRQKNNNRMMVVHYGNKLRVTLDYFSKPQSKKVNGLILISAYDKPEQKDILDLLEKVNFPTMDIVGQFDYGFVLKQAKERRNQVGGAEKNYQNLTMPGARHQYWYAIPMLVAYLNGWMLKQDAEEPVKPPINLR
ncbi:ATPases involved in biogenesis of archaeal flagella [Legionella rubrilucens]|uniref:ATPases involved in biogenesis of archaeal flagella n=1 Tax=Legionella rubrilucens TaxID=458 RepID=A0A0W0XR59_9GAMM|nr:DUF3530 family protein [Legionella rubrilucens]KTD47112.1 ATPases involved in biogenesis of archaeal flagella [Legionella rubrilucens]